MFLSKNKGFTLIEILLVIGILVILITAIIVAINPVRQFKQARNVTRGSHINSIKNAVYSYQIENKGKYPDCIPEYSEVADVFECETELIPIFIAKLPKDPKQGEKYMIGYEDESQMRIKVYSTSLEHLGIIPEEPQPPALPVTNGLVIRLDANAITGLGGWR